MLIEPNELLITEDDIENGLYRGAMFKALVDADLTGTDRAEAILGAEFIKYLTAFFGGWKFVRRVEPRSRYKGGPVWKHVSYVLVFSHRVTATSDLQSRGGSAMARGRRSRVRSNRALSPPRPTHVTGTTPARRTLDSGRRSA